MTERKIFKVIKIIDDYRVVINAGKEQGMSPGQEFEVFVKGVELKDEETGESYGTLDYIKATIEANNVFDKASVCKNTETYREESSPLQVAAAGLTRLGKTKTYPKKLNVEQSQITGYGFDIDKQIKIGDLVRKKEY